MCKQHSGKWNIRSFGLGFLKKVNLEVFFGPHKNYKNTVYIQPPGIQAKGWPDMRLRLTFGALNIPFARVSGLILKVN